MYYQTYQDFDLLFERIPAAEHETYQVRLLNSPAGETKVEFGKYYSPQQWAVLKTPPVWEDLGSSNLLNTTSATTVVASITPHEWGQLLFEHVFHSNLLQCWTNSLAYVNQNNSGLRVLLRFNDVPELANLRWEYLYSPSVGFFALSAKTPIIRYLELPQGTDVKSVTDKLRVLVVAPQPNDMNSLNVNQELDDLKSAFEESSDYTPVQVEVIPGTLEHLQQHLLQVDKPVHILHFIGHGEYDAARDEGALLFETRNQQADFVTANRLATLLRDHKSLRLIFLNSCKGATSGTKDIFSGLAQHLVKNMPGTLMAVIAMQSAVSDQTAINLSRKFYEAIAAGYPVDAALAEARKAVYTQDNNDEWGIPVLFMRVRNGKLFDISKSAQHPGFQTLSLRSLEKQIEPKVSRKLLKFLCDNRILILSEESQATLRVLAHQAAYRLWHEYPDLAIWEWQKDPEDIDFRCLFPLSERINRAPDNSLFIIPEVSHDLLASTFLADLAPLLRIRNQYLILITTASKNYLTLNTITAKFWVEQERRIYKSAYLLTELEQRLQKNEKRLPSNLLVSLKANQPALGYSLHKIAVELRLPEQMETFVERLCRPEEQVTKEYIKKLIRVSLEERDGDRIRYLYHHLPQRSEQLLVVGLCLLGGITESQFFHLLERIIKSSWQYAFSSQEILDYYHLNSVRQFFNFDEPKSKQYPIERIIAPQYTNQWWHLLVVIWESHRNHLRKTFPELALIIMNSISGQRDNYGNEQQRQQLRTSLGTLFSNVGRVSLPSIEQTLLDLASHRDRSVQAVASNALAKWYDINEKGNAREQLFNLLQRWLSYEWKSEQRDHRYICLTAARTLNQVLDKVSAPLPDPVPALLLNVVQSYEKVQKFFRDNMSYKIFPEHTSCIIKSWQEIWESSEKDEIVVEWLEVIKIIAPLCKRHLQLDLTGTLLVDILAHSIKKHGGHVVTLLQENRYLINEVFPTHILRLNADGTLLYLACCGRFEGEIKSVFLRVYSRNPLLIMTMVKQWQELWLPCLAQINALENEGWYKVLTLVGKFYDDIKQFDRFEAWLPPLIMEDDIYTQSQLVEVFYGVNKYQREKIENTVFDEFYVSVTPTDIERIVYNWLTDPQKDAAFHLIVFWFSAKLQGGIDRRSMRRNFNVSFYLKKLVPFLVSPFTHRYRLIVSNLLVVVDGIFRDRPSEVNRIIENWKQNPDEHIQRIAHRLQWALYICKASRLLNSFVEKISQ